MLFPRVHTHFKVYTISSLREENQVVEISAGSRRRTVEQQQ